MSFQPVSMRNGDSIALADLAVGTMDDLRSLVIGAVASGSRLAALFPLQRGGDRLLTAVLANPGTRDFGVVAAGVGDGYPSLTPECPAAHLFEREIAERWRIVPEGHPWPKPVRFLAEVNGGRGPRPPEGFAAGRGPAVMDFYRVEGDGVHEVAVGPVHAGVIEPGHFRFQCRGEKVMHLEISLGYQHRGVEDLLVGGPARLGRHLIETAAGDTSCGHGLVHAMIVEALAGLDADPRCGRARGIGLELERIANHVGDLGALAGDVGYLPTASYCGRLRGDILNITALLCGNRFGRGWIVPGGVGAALDSELAGRVAERLKKALADIRSALALLFSAPSVLARFEGTGRVDAGDAKRLGLVGPAARASGLADDARIDFPAGPYAAGLCEPPAVAPGDHGDVLDRARQRRHEIETSARLIERWLGEDCSAAAPDPYAAPDPRPNRFAVAAAEGWRGRVFHAAATGADGRFLFYKIVDPSFHNWQGLAMALRGGQISDFPLCNKSFNLSYCGHDL